MKADYSRLPQALLPAVTFMVAAMLCQTLAAYLFREMPSADAVILFDAAAVLVLVFLFRLVFGPVFLLSSEVFRNKNANTENTAGYCCSGSVLFAAAVFAAAALNITAALVFPAAVTDNASAPASLTVLLVSGCIVVPACEELIFRCHLFPVLLRLKDPRTAVLICSLLFGIYHEDLIQGIYAFIISLLLCIGYLHLGGFKSAFPMHAGVNLAMIVLSRSGLLEKLVFPSAAAAFAGISAVCVYTYFSLRRVLHL
ncbi:MAG: CPBP family intramembrane metalloprotease [Lachnospiraceae bacterium]|nr:CPBP family intramembrane metalloprotease [Lachnospiraceae bacterium]